MLTRLHFVPNLALNVVRAANISELGLKQILNKMTKSYKTAIVLASSILGYTSACLLNDTS